MYIIKIDTLYYIMPEGPDVRIFADNIRFLIGSRILAVECDKFDLSVIVGREIINVESYGKYLYIYLTKRILVVHFMLNGKPEFTAPDKYFAKIDTTQGVLYFCDKSRLMKLYVIRNATFTSEDIFYIFEDTFVNILSKKRGMIFNALVDQSNFVGIGSYLANEILYSAGIIPFKKIKDMSGEDIRRIYRSMKTIIETIVNCGGNVKYGGTWEPAIYKKKYDPEGREIIRAKNMYYVPELQT